MKNSLINERAKIKITQSELAKIINVSRRTIHAIEAEKFVPSTLIALKIADFFNVNLEEIFILENTD